MERSTTLLSETGNVSRYRVREEVRELVRADTAQKRADLERHNANFRERVRQEQNNLLKRYEDSRLQQLDLWKRKTKNSPLKMDQNMIHMQTAANWKARFALRAHRKKQNETLRSMTGKPIFDICTDEYVKSINDPEKRLAMERRKLLLESKTVSNERKKLDHMVDNTLEEVERRFPKIALQLAFGSNNMDSVRTALVGSGSVAKQKVSAEKARELKEQDNNVYSAAGRYDELGRFVLTDQLKTKGGMVSADAAKASGTSKISTEFTMTNSIELGKQIKRQMSQGRRSESRDEHDGPFSGGRRGGGLGELSLDNSTIATGSLASSSANSIVSPKGRAATAGGIAIISPEDARFGLTTR